MRTRNKSFSRCVAAGLLAAAVALVPQAASADEKGVSLWLPGIFGSLAAVPRQPGFSLTTIERIKVVEDTAPTLDAKGNLVFSIPSYVFATPVFGGQAAVGLLGMYGRVAATLNGADFISDSVTGFGDLYPQFSLRWNAGVHNFMTYVVGQIPVGAYVPTRVSNIGNGFGGLDSGVGYTYFNSQTGHEFSAVAGLSYNFINPDTNYRNGVDFHLDWGASQFLTKQLHIGVAGYVYDEVGCDSGSGNRVGCFQSRVIAVGPQIGFVIPMGEVEGYLNFRAYKEFDNQNRPSDWNMYTTLVLSPAPPNRPR